MVSNKERISRLGGIAEATVSQLGDIWAEIRSLRQEVQAEIGSVRQDLQAEISSTRNTMIMLSLVLWMTTIGTLFGLFLGVR